MPKFKYTKITSTDLLLEVNINKLTDEEQILMFGNNYCNKSKMENVVFIQKEDYIFGINIMLYLGINPTYCLLKKGTYPSCYSNEKLQVWLSLTHAV